MEDFQQISLSYERRTAERKYPRGLNDIAKTASMAREVFRNPEQLHWLAFDAGVFTKLLRRLTELNDHLTKLMRGSQAQQLEETTRRIYLEIVQVRSSIEE